MSLPTLQARICPARGILVPSTRDDWYANLVDETRGSVRSLTCMARDISVPVAARGWG